MQTNKKNLLIIEEDYVYFLFIKEVLPFKDFDIIRALSVNDAKEIISDGQEVDLILFDLISSSNRERELHSLRSLADNFNTLLIADMDCCGYAKNYFIDSIFLAESLSDVIQITEAIEDVLNIPQTLVIN